MRESRGAMRFSIRLRGAQSAFGLRGAAATGVTMKRPRARVFLAALLLAVVLMLMLATGGREAAAQTAIGPVSIQPAYPDERNPRSRTIFVHEIIPGTAASDGVLVVNDDTAAHRVRLYAADYHSTAEGGFVCEQYDEPRDAVGAWIALERGELVLEPGTVDIVPFTIQVPEDAEPGESNGCIALEVLDAAPMTPGETGISVRTRSAIRVALLLPGELTKRVDIADLREERTQDGLQFTVALKNTGSVSADADVALSLRTGLFGREIESLGGTFAVFRDTTRVLRLSSATTPPMLGGWYRAELTARYDPDPDIPLGMRTYGEPVTRRAQAHYLVWPSALGLVLWALVIGGVLALALAWAARERRRHRAYVADWEPYAVQPGDDIGRLAEQFGVSWRTLARANNLTPPFRIAPGESILAPKRRETKNEDQGIGVG